MHGFDAGALAMQSAEDVHEAGVVDCGADFGAGVFDAAELVGEHGGGDVAVLDGEGAAEAAALIDFLQIDEVDAAHFSQQAQWQIVEMQAAQRVAAGVVGDAVRVVGVDIFEAEFVDQEFGQFVDAGQ